MNKIALLLIVTLCSAMALVAQQDNNNVSNKPKDMIGWVCNAKCVEQSSGTATCNQNCSEAAGEVVFISDTGQVTKIANQQVAQPMAGKKCKIKATKDPDTGMLAIQNIIQYGG